MAINFLKNDVAERTQAAGLVRLVREFEEKGFEMRVSAKGELWGIRRARMIKGQKADYSNEYFKIIGAGIYERETMRLVDILSA